MSENTIEMSETKNFAKVFATPERDYLVVRSFNSSDEDSKPYYVRATTHAQGAQIEFVMKFANEAICFAAYKAANAENIAAIFKDTLASLSSFTDEDGEADNG